jgi:tryptophanyl-tRNA synthetase
VVEKFENDFNQCRIRYGDMKKQLAEDLIRFIKPIQERAAALQNDPALINDIMERGAEKARKSAGATLLEVRKALGFKYL